MQNPDKDKWERKKRYLFRNILVDPGFSLSPVPEESSSDERAYSPLPDLIIEPEPNRHDETPEFYRGLVVRMKRYHRRLFLDGATEEDSVEYGGPVNIDEEISEFDVNRSMASTFVIDRNNSKDNEQNRSTPDEHKADSENPNVSAVALLEEIQEVSKNIETPLKDTLRQDERETNDVVNIGKDRRVSNEEMHKSVETESDSTQDHHRISYTVAQIHEERKRSGPITRVFEGGSPVLIPRPHQFSGHIFEALPAAETNFRRRHVAEIDGVEENKPEEIQDKGMYDKSRKREKSLNEADEKNYFDTITDYLNLDLEVENLMQSTEVAYNSIQTNDIDRHSHESVDKAQSENNGEKSYTSIISNAEINSEIDEEWASRDEETINEYDYTQGNRTDNLDTDEDYMAESDDNSFEMAVRREIFVDEELASSSESDSKESEPIEVMRDATQTKPFEALRGKSTMSQESPLVGTFTIPVAAEFEEETSFQRLWQTDYLQRATDKQDLTEDLKNKSISFNTGRTKESSIDREEAAPTKPSNTLVTTRSHDIWSVSPIEINITDLSPIIQNIVASTATEDLNKVKRGAETAIDLEAPEKKRKKYQNTEVQTSAPIETCQGWEHVNTDFVVGKPLVFNLCRCQNHICP